MTKTIGNTNLPLCNVHEDKAKYVYEIDCVCMCVCEGQKSCLYTGGKGPSSLFKIEGCF